MNEISLSVNDPKLTATTFLSLVQRVWPGTYNSEKTVMALSTEKGKRLKRGLTQ